MPGFRGLRRAFGAVAKSFIGPRVKKAVKKYYGKGKKKSLPFSKPRKYIRPKVKKTGDADGNQVVSVKHGKNYRKLNPKMEAKIRSVLNPNFQEIYQDQRTIFVDGYGYKVNEVFELNRTPHIDNFLSSGGANTTGTALNRAGKINLANSEMEVNLTNMANTTLLMKVYEYIFRRDLPAKLWDGTAYQNADTKWIVDNGFGFYSNAGMTTTPNQLTYGARLFDNPLFTSYCKIVNVRDYELAPGKNMMLKMSDAKDHHINTLVWDQTDTSAEGHITRGYVIEFRSSAVANSTLTAASTGKIRVEAVVMCRYQFDQAWSGSNKINVYDGITHGFASAQIMNQATATQTAEVLV